MKSLALRGRVVTETEVWEEGTILVEDGKIRGVSRGPLPADRTVELPGSYLAPGFVDLQVNGGFGVDLVADPGRRDELSAALPATGVTSYLPTVVSLPLERYPEVLGELSSRRPGPTAPTGAEPPGAEPLGLHLEGPFISTEKRGAHAAEAIAGANAGAVAAPGLEALARMLEAGRVALVTLAPEVPGARRLIGAATGRGVVVSLGHSAASFGEGMAAFGWGAAGVTHLFNAMSPLHHRDPGLPGAALAHPRVRCGVVADGRHVHPEMVRLAFERLGPDRMYLVTDAMAAAGGGDGEYGLAGRAVLLRDGAPRLEDGTLAGSVLTMDEALRNVLEWTGCSLPEAVRLAATTPADLIPAGRRKGRLAPGFDADIVALSETLEVEATWVGGELFHGRSSGGSPEGTKNGARDAGRRVVLGDRGPGSTPLERMSLPEMLREMNREDAGVAPAVERALPQLERVVQSAREVLSGGGRVIYAGAGTSGRLAVSEAAECVPTFGVEPGSFVGIMAGGSGAFSVEVGEAEDDAAAGRRAVRDHGVGAGDLVVAVSASGRTPFTRAVQSAARERGARTACVVNAAGSDMARDADLPVEIKTGPEILAGSTRLKAGTAQKLALNAISTAALAGLGYVYGNLMIGVQPRNRKLRERAEGMVREITNCGASEATSALARAGYDVRTAVLLVDGAASVGEATRLLRRAGGDLRRVRESLVPVGDG